MGAVDLTSASFWRSAEPYVLGDASAAAELVACAGAGDWCFVQTSGTEGRAKWVALTKSGLLAAAESANKHLAAPKNDRWLVALPLHHVGGFSILARAFVSGAAVEHFEGKWNPERFVECCVAKGTTLTSLVPTQVFDLTRAQLRAPSCLRAVVVGGGGLSKAAGEAARALGWPVLQSFGMTEAASQIATEPLDHLSSGFEPDALEVLPHWYLSTTPESHLIIKGPSLAKGYIIAEDAGAWRWHPIDADQGLITRDRVALTTEGQRTFLRFVGRESQALKILGELVHLGPLQARLDALAMSGNQAVIVPIPDERKGTALVLAVTDTAFGESLREKFNATATVAFERLDRVVKVERIPLTDLGKVRLEELRQGLLKNQQLFAC